ncbi:hypothetical protein GO003_002390 [Methylicorpusculum oleiharenae]|uniref:hypothetical protein n=1 Tax=Methylicorpusculum oleiharenae TaxID=1338687 RepID=UPI001359EBB6|nr:hypothetical protein [Methylicorpusculum oleiharenae]MCD2449238.1 hypothetical protein [Methylicorpusculum oleiharenae]
MSQLCEKIQSLLKTDQQEAVIIEPEDQLITTAAVPHGDEAESIHPGKRRLKENYTSHWDLDYLPKQEVDRIMTDCLVIGRTESLAVFTPSSREAE